MRLSTPSRTVQVRPIKRPATRISGFKKDIFAMTFVACTGIAASHLNSGVQREIKSSQVAESSNIRAEEREVRWFLKSFYESVDKNLSFEVALPLVRFIRSAARAGNFTLVDELMKLISVDRLSNTTAIALVRSSFICRGDLENWNFALHKVKLMLVARGANATHLLRGLE